MNTKFKLAMTSQQRKPKVVADEKFAKWWSWRKEHASGAWQLCVFFHTHGGHAENTR